MIFDFLRNHQIWIFISIIKRKVGPLDRYALCPLRHAVVNPVRNSSGALNPALRGGTPYGAEPGIILKSNPATGGTTEQRALFLTG